MSASPPAPFHRFPLGATPTGPPPPYMTKRSPLVALALLAFLPTAARAQETEAESPPPPVAPAVVPPKLARDAGVTYPQTALDSGYYESVSVELVVQISVDGTVTDASLLAPRGDGFDEAALAAARHLRFEPALRNGQPAAARIKYRYVFEAPSPALRVVVKDPETGAPLAGVRVTLTRADGQTVELVTDERGELGGDVRRGAATVRIELDGYEAQSTRIELLPGKETRLDVALERTPSAPAAGEGGAAEPETEIVIEGERPAPAVTSMTRAEVRQMPGAFGDPFRAIEALPGVTPIISGLPFFYVRGAPPGNVGYYLDGVRVPYLYHLGFGPSVVHPGIVERVDLYSGGYPARYGRYAGGIVSAETTAPRADLHGEGNIRLFDAGAMVESGFADGRGTVLVGGRYSYTAMLLSLLAPDTKLDYRDYQARATYQLTPKDTLSVFSFGAYDLLGTVQDDELRVIFGTEFYRAGLRHEHLDDDGKLSTTLTLGYDQSHLDNTRNTQSRLLGVRSDYSTRIGERSLLRAGTDVLFESYTADEPPYADPDNPQTEEFNNQFPARQDLGVGLWVDAVLDVAPGFEVIPGMRADLYRSGDASAIGLDPRIAARIAVNDRVTIVHAYGIAHQAPSFAIPLPGLAAGGLDEGLQTSAQTSTGVELKLPEDVTAKSTVFYNAFFDMTDALGSSSGGDEGDNGDRSNGSAMGLELSLHRDMTKRLGGFVSYTLSRSLRTVGREKFFASFDRTHVLNAALGYDLGRNWRAGARYVFYTGTPIYEEGVAAPPRTTDDVERTPAFHRLDVRVEKRWNLGDTRWLSFVIEGMNVTLSKETIGGEEIGPLSIPSLGLEGGF